MYIIVGKWLIWCHIRNEDIHKGNIHCNLTNQQFCRWIIHNFDTIMELRPAPGSPLFAMSPHGPFTRYVKLRVAHALGMPPTSKETASLRPWHASRHVRHARAVMHVGIAYPRWRGKRSQHSRRMRSRNFTYLVRGPYATTFCMDEHWRVWNNIVKQHNGITDPTGSKGTIMIANLIDKFKTVKSFAIIQLFWIRYCCIDGTVLDTGIAMEEFLPLRETSHVLHTGNPDASNNFIMVQVKCKIFPYLE